MLLNLINSRKNFFFWNCQEKYYFKGSKQEFSFNFWELVKEKIIYINKRKPNYIIKNAYITKFLKNNVSTDKFAYI